MLATYPIHIPIRIFLQYSLFITYKYTLFLLIVNQLLQVEVVDPTYLSHLPRISSTCFSVQCTTGHPLIKAYIVPPLYECGIPSPTQNIFFFMIACGIFQISLCCWVISHSWTLWPSNNAIFSFSLPTSSSKWSSSSSSKIFSFYFLMSGIEQASLSLLCTDTQCIVCSLKREPMIA